VFTSNKYNYQPKADGAPRAVFGFRFGSRAACKSAFVSGALQNKPKMQFSKNIVLGMTPPCAIVPTHILFNSSSYQYRHLSTNSSVNIRICTSTRKD
jgi:hypothetical protein